MSDVVIASNQSIKTDKIAYLNNLGAGAGSNFVVISANANQYFEIDYFHLNSGSCFWQIYSPDLLTVLYQSASATSHEFNGVDYSIATGPRKYFKIPNGCELRVTTPVAATTIKVSGTAFTNSP